MSPKEVVKEWVKIFNHADEEKLSSLYSDDAINHQVMNEPNNRQGCDPLNV